MDTGQALTRFFKRDSTKANNLTLYPGREREFWIWCASWGLFLQKPSDLGFSDEGYSLPPLDIRYHRLDTDLADAGATRMGSSSWHEMLHSVCRTHPGKSGRASPFGLLRQSVLWTAIQIPTSLSGTTWKMSGKQSRLLFLNR